MRIFDAQQDERDQRHAGHAVGFEAVSAGADRVAGIVARAVGDNAGVARIVFLDLEDDLHQVGADVGDLGEDAAGDTQRGCAQRLADRESDKALAGVVARNEQQDAQHDQQLDADQHHADAHARLERNGINGIGLAAQSGERRARVGKGVDPDAEPRHAVAARDADQAEQQDNRQGDSDRFPGNGSQPSEVRRNDDRDEGPQHQDEFALRDQIGFAGLVNQLGNLAHGAVDGSVLELHVNRQPKHQSEHAEEQADQQQVMPGHAEKADRAEIGELQIRFPGGFARLSKGRRGIQHEKSEG